MRLIRARPLTSFLMLAYSITWLFALPSLLSLKSPWDGMPDNLWHSLGVLGPVVGVWVVVAVCQGQYGLKDMLGRLLDWRIGLHWALVGLGMPALLFGASILLARVIGHPWIDLIGFGFKDSAGFTWGYWVLVAWLPSLVYAIGEEVGWRGFVLARLQYRYDAFTATALVALLWSLWNMPFYLLQAEIDLAQLLGLLASLFAEAIVLSYLYNSTQGSLFLVVIWHLSWSTWSLLALLTSVPLVSLMSALLMLVAVSLLIRLDPKTLTNGRRGKIPSWHISDANAGLSEPGAPLS